MMHVCIHTLCRVNDGRVMSTSNPNHHPLSCLVFLAANNQNDYTDTEKDESSNGPSNCPTIPIADLKQFKIIRENSFF